MISRHFLVTLAILTAIAASSRPAEPLKDRSGDPLPEGAVARLGSTRLFHPNVHFLAFSWDSKRLASANSQGVVRIWDVATGKQLLQIETPRFRAYSPSWPLLAFSPDGKTLAMGCADSKVRLWDSETGKEILELPGRTTSLVFSPDGTRLARNNDGGIDVYDLKEKKVIRSCSFKIKGSPDVAFSPNSKTLIAYISGVNAERVQVVSWDRWDIASGKSLGAHSITNAKVLPSTLSPDGQYLAGRDNEAETIHLWDAKTGKEVRATEKTAKGAISISFSDDSKLISATSRDGMIRVWDTGTGKEVHQLKGHKALLRRVLLSPDGRLLASASYRDDSIHIWDLATEKKRITLPGHRSGRLTAQFTDQGKTILTTSQDHIHSPFSEDYSDWSIRTWEASGKELRNFDFDNQEEVHLTAFSKEGRLLATVTKSGVLRLWDVDGPKLLRQWNLPTKEITSTSRSKDGKILRQRKTQTVLANNLAFSPDSKIVVTNDKKNIRFWDVGTGKELHVKEQADDQMCCVFSPAEDVLAVTGTRQGMFLLDAKTGRQIRDFGKMRSWNIAFSPDGRMIASAKGQELTLWEAASGKERKRFEANVEMIHSVAFSPNGQLLVTGSGHDKCLVRILRVADGQKLADFEGHTTAITSLDWSPDGSRLVSSGYDNTALVWDVSKFSKPPLEIRATPGKLTKLWDDLASDDASKAFEAIQGLVSARNQSADFIGNQLKPVPNIDDKQLKKWLDDLGNENFANREAATKTLRELGDKVEIPLRERLQNNPPLEVQRRLEGLLKRIETPSPESLRTIRAVEALEGIGTKEAQKVLKRLASGQPSARLTWEAKKALERLERRSKE